MYDTVGSTSARRAPTRLGLAVALSLAAASAGAYDLLPYASFDVGSHANAVAIGDLDGNGRNDVVLVTDYYFDELNDYSTFVFLQQDDATLAPPIRTRYLASANRNGVELIDLDGDGRNELVVGHFGGITIQRWNGTGFDSELVSASNDADVLVQVDVDRDGNSDLIGFRWSGSATVFHGNGTGGFSHTSTISTPLRGYNDVEVADMNGDGAADLVLSSGQGLPYGFWVMHHDGVAGFLAPVFVSLPSNASGIAVGDFNHDGLPDVLGSQASNSPTSVHLATGQPDGSLVHTTSYPSYDIPEPLEAADVDNDGFVDALAVHGGWNRVGTYMGNGTGLDPERLFAIPYASHYQAEGLALGDINSDGCSDVAIADYNQGLVTLLGQGCLPVMPPPPPVVDIALTASSDGRYAHYMTVSHVDGEVAAADTLLEIAFTADRGKYPSVSAPASCTQTESGRTVAFLCEIGSLSPATAETLYFRTNSHHLSVAAGVSTGTLEDNLDNNAAAY